MNHNLFVKGVVPLLALFSAQAAALPFQSIDPRSLSMGGTGTASGTSANAAFMNPALLAAARESEDFSLELPIISGRFMDQDDLVDEIDNYQNNNLESNLTNAINAFKLSQTDGNAAAVATEAGLLWEQLHKLSNKSVQGEFSGGFVVGIPSKKLGASLSANARVVGGGLLEVPAADDALINGIVADGQTSAAALAANSAIQDQITETEDVVQKLTSNLQARGAVISEISLALAREFTIAGASLAIGLTPKYQQITTFDYVADVNTAEIDADQGKKEYSDFNFDIGAAKDYGNGWKVGLVVKNLIGQEYETVLGSGLKIEPQARLGVSHATQWTTVALDVDLNESESFGFDAKTQYIGFGAELDVFETVQLRLGYRHNMSDSDTSMPTVGLGLSPFGVHIDIAAAANEDEIAAAMQLGFRF